MRTGPGRQLIEPDTGAGAAGNTEQPSAQRTQQTVATRVPSISTALGVPPCQPMPGEASPLSRPGGNDVSERIAVQAQVRAPLGITSDRDVFSEIPEEIILHVARFAKGSAAARLSLANHRLYAALRDDRLVA